ncbi:MAG: hypothetical protein KKA22_12935 [Gammaproteobacteria bacterium]|nr:hypothetical protein [Gammaproteobacteria bacterium]MBU1409041.1 hypothetical protein [Gammaproteobacteria bacterium]MBU1533538.1 hypothetical protein [Gammaproteobacteria bacterium]
MNSNNDIDVKLGADFGELDKGMDAAANVVKIKSDRVNEILRKNAQETASIARKQAQQMEEQARKQAEAVERATKESADRMANIGRDLQSRIVGMFSLGAIVGFVNQTKQAVTEAEASYRGLEAVANYTGVGIGAAMKAAGDLAADGLMSTAEASKSLQNLLSRGYSLEQAMNTLTRLKDAAAYNRQANLEMGEAVLNATEGLKNENSILVDNAGVTKNVAKMWDEYAAAHGKTANNLTQAEKIQAEYNGVMAETEAQVGNAAKASEGLQGKSARLATQFNNMKVSIGEKLTPAFMLLADIAGWVMTKFDTFTRLIQISGAQIGKWGADVAAVFNAVTNWDFSNLRGQLASNATVLSDMVDDIMTAKPGSSFAAAPDTGKRKGPEAAPPPGKSGGKAKNTGGSDDVFDNGSFITPDRGVADFIRQQYDAVNGLQGEIVREAQHAAAKVAEAQKKSAEQRKQVEWLWAQDAAAAQLHQVDAAEQAAHQQVEMGLLTKAELLAAEQEFEQRRYEIQLQALNDRLALFAADPSADPVAKAQALIAIEELERQHQSNIAAIRTEALAEQFDPMRAAYQSLEQNMAGTLQRLFTLQTSLGGALKSLWQGVTNAIAGEFAKMTAKIIMEKIKMLVFGKSAAMSEISAASAKAGANGVASWAAAPWPINIGAPAFGAAMAASALAFAPAASFAVGAWELPGDMVAKVHKGETILPKTFAEDFRENGGSLGGGSRGGDITINIHAMDGQDVRRVLLDNSRHVAEAIKEHVRGFGE